MSLEIEPSGSVAQFVIARSVEEMKSLHSKEWRIVVGERDFRLSAVITLIKSAYLTLFSLLGYRWALAADGISAGHDILGKFFLENQDKEPSAIRDAAKQFFFPYRHMVRPMDAWQGEPPMRGTIEDNLLGVCLGSSGRPFATAVVVRIDQQYHSVLMPAFDNPESAKTYWDFLTNDQETLWITKARFNSQEGKCEIAPEPVEAHWPKQGEFGFE